MLELIGVTYKNRGHIIRTVQKKGSCETLVTRPTRLRTPFEMVTLRSSVRSPGALKAKWKPSSSSCLACAAAESSLGELTLRVRAGSASGS